MKNYLITSLGANQLSPTIYHFNEKSYETEFCCLALTQLLEINFEKIFVLLTPEAKEKHGSKLLEIAAELKLLIEIIDIKTAKTISEIWELFDNIADNIAKIAPAQIFLDITNAFRHLPLLTFTSLNYLESLYDIKLAGIYYGAFEAKEDNVTPIFNLTPMVNIVRGAFQVKNFEETGSVGQLGQFLGEIANIPPGEKKNFNKRLGEINDAISSGLTLEAGLKCHELLRQIKKLNISNFELKSATFLFERLGHKLAEISRQAKGKAQISLNYDELEKQLNFVKWQINTKNPDLALLLLREWVVNRVWLQMQPHNSEWLKVKEREAKVERALGFWSYKARTAKNKQIFQSWELFNLWTNLSRNRNQFAHAGFQSEKVYPEDALRFSEECYQDCLKNLKNNKFWQLPQNFYAKENGKTTLITGMGASFGLVYSAAKLLGPDMVIVLTSEKYADNAVEALKKAGSYKDDQIKIITMKNVFKGFDETAGLLNQIFEELRETAKVFVNLTGGTTAMQWVMQSAYERAKENDFEVKRVAFVDERNAADQQANPWVLGEMVKVEELIKLK
jgi:CRISPR-associated Csx2 family protein